ncbi:MAG: hypothetical protein GX442_20570 [Candidatus Riflebacteria bacterium]|nr:hypothetical protein [Candidatus Riflebacteria bacterium]
MPNDLPTSIPASHAAPPVSRILAPFVLLLAATAIGAWVTGLGADVRQWRLDRAVIEGDLGMVTAALEANDPALLQDPARTLTLALAADQPEVVGFLLGRPEIRAAADDVDPFNKAVNRLSPRLFRFLLEQGLPLPSTSAAGLARSALTDGHLLPRRGDEDGRRLELVRLLHGRGAYSSLPAEEIQTLLEKPDMAGFAALLKSDATLSGLLRPQPTPSEPTPAIPPGASPTEPAGPKDVPPAGSPSPASTDAPPAASPPTVNATAAGADPALSTPAMSTPEMSTPVPATPTEPAATPPGEATTAAGTR